MVDRAAHAGRNVPAVASIRAMLSGAKACNFNSDYNAQTFARSTTGIRSAGLEQSTAAFPMEALPEPARMSMCTLAPSAPRSEERARSQVRRIRMPLWAPGLATFPRQYRAAHPTCRRIPLVRPRYQTMCSTGIMFRTDRPACYGGDTKQSRGFASTSQCQYFITSGDLQLAARFGPMGNGRIETGLGM